MIATITFVYTFPLSSAQSFANQVAEAGAFPLPLAQYGGEVFPLHLVSKVAAQGAGPTAGKIVLTIVYSPIQPAFNNLFAGANPTFAQAEALVKNLWTMVLAIGLCTVVDETITVA